MCDRHPAVGQCTVKQTFTGERPHLLRPRQRRPDHLRLLHHLALCSVVHQRPKTIRAQGVELPNYLKCQNSAVSLNLGMCVCGLKVVICAEMPETGCTKAQVRTTYAPVPCRPAAADGFLQSFQPHGQCVPT